MHDHDQDYEVTEPVVATDEDSDAQRLHSGRFWRSQASSAEADPASAGSGDGVTGTDSQAVAEGDPDAADEAALDDDLVLGGDDAVLGDDVVVAEVIDVEPGSPAADEQRPGSPVVVPGAREAADPEATDPEATDPEATDPEAAADSRDVAGAADPAAVAEPGADRPEQSFGIQEWRDIQAGFVDDPHGAVQMAAQAAESALTALVTALRERQASLDPSATQDTEQLRAALQEYRKFCQAISEVGRSLPQSSASR